MRLLFTSPVPDDRQLDIPRAFHSIGEEMQRRGHVVHYFFGEDGPKLKFKQAAALEWAIRAAPLIGQKCQKNRYDIIIVTSASGWVLSTFRKWLLPYKTKVVSWYHHGDGGDEALSSPLVSAGSALAEYRPKSSPQARLIENLLLWAGRKSLTTQDGALFTSTEEREWMQRQHPMHAPKALYQPKGVSARYYYPERFDDPLFEYPKGHRLKLLFTGLTGDEKADAHIADVFTAIHHKYPNARLSLWDAKLDPGQMLSAFPEAARAAVDVLSVSDELERIEQYQQHDIFVMPGLNESLPLTVLEAMASAMPVITTNHNGAQDIIINGENGLLIPNQSKLALSDAIEQLIEQPDLRKSLGMAAYETASRCYTWRQVSDIFEENLYRILHKKLPVPDWMMAGF